MGTKIELWRAKFTESSTRVAFNLTLSKNHVRLLELLEDADKMNARDYTRFKTDKGIDYMIPAFRGLERRGLAEHNTAEVEKIKPPGIGWDKIKWIYRLTPAGHQVLALLRIAGIVAERQEIRTATSKTAKRRR